MRHVGPWADTHAGAVSAALAEVKVCVGDYVTCHYEDSVTLVPVDPAGPWEIHAEVSYSESRDQYRCSLRRLSHVDRIDS